MKQITIALSTDEDANHLRELVKKISAKFPQVVFERVGYNNFTELTYDELYFDGWLNPGSNDTFPVGIPNFTKEEWLSQGDRIDLDHLYQGIMEYVHKHDIPTFGICGGSQHLLLYNQGSMQPVRGFRKVETEIHYKDLTHSSFATMTIDEQKDALYNCTSPVFTIEAVTINSFAGVSHEIGGLELGAVAKKNESIAKAFSHASGLHLATQYHLEKKYDICDRQTNIIDHFIRQAAMKRAEKDFGFYNVTKVFAAISERIAECNISPKCFIEPVEDTCSMLDTMEVYVENYFQFEM